MTTENRKFSSQLNKDFFLSLEGCNNVALVLPAAKSSIELKIEA
jgi:hypothetical protein